MHQPRTHLVLAGLALLLIAGFCFEFHLLSVEGHGGIDLALQLPGTDPTMQTVQGGLPQRKDIESWSSVALTRPIFSPGRALPQDVVQETDPPPLPRLTGIVITPENQLGIFRGANGDPVIVKAGALLGAYKIVSIAADGVRLSGSSGVQTVHIAFGDGPAAANPITPPHNANAAAASLPGSNAWPIQLKLLQQQYKISS